MKTGDRVVVTRKCFYHLWEGEVVRMGPADAILVDFKLDGVTPCHLAEGDVAVLDKEGHVAQ